MDKLDMTFKFETFPISINKAISGETEIYIKWLAYAQQIIFDQYRRKYDTVYTDRIFAVLRLYINNFATRDIDNYIKIMLDALKGTVIEDDETVDLLIVYKLKGKPYKSSFAEIQVCDMTKPIVLSEIIPKTDYIWMREKNKEIDSKIVTKQSQIANGTLLPEKTKETISFDKFEKIINKKINSNKLFKLFCKHIKGEVVLSKEEKKKYNSEKRIATNCMLLIKKVEYSDKNKAEIYQKYRKNMEKSEISGLILSKKEFNEYFNSTYKNEIGD